MGLNCEPKRSHGHIKSRMATDQVYRSGPWSYLQYIYKSIRFY